MNRLLLRLEGVSVLILAAVLYWKLGGPWLWFAVGMVAPDLGLLGYMAGSRAGAIAYNAVHNYVMPLALLGAGYLLKQQWMVLAAIPWAGHIGMDRMLGMGLRYPSDPKASHIARV